MPKQHELTGEFPIVTHEDLLETIQQVFDSGANTIDPKEIFGPDLKGVPTSLSSDVPTMFPHVESTT